jgi:hypothetical protein
MLRVNPQERISTHKILKHSFFKDYDFSRKYKRTKFKCNYNNEILNELLINFPDYIKNIVKYMYSRSNILGDDLKRATTCIWMALKITFYFLQPTILSKYEKYANLSIERKICECLNYRLYVI